MTISGTLQVTRRETRADYDGRQDLAISQDPRHHHPAPKLQEGRQEQIVTGQDPAISLDPRHHHPAPKLHKLQKGRQEEIVMGDKTWRFPLTPGTTIRLPSYTNYKRETGRDCDGRQDVAISRDPWHNYDFCSTNLEP